MSCGFPETPVDRSKGTAGKEIPANSCSSERSGPLKPTFKLKLRSCPTYPPTVASVRATSRRTSSTRVRSGRFRSRPFAVIGPSGNSRPGSQVPTVWASGKCSSNVASTWAGWSRSAMWPSRSIRMSPRSPFLTVKRRSLPSRVTVPDILKGPSGRSCLSNSLPKSARSAMSTRVRRKTPSSMRSSSSEPSMSARWAASFNATPDSSSLSPSRFA